MKEHRHPHPHVDPRQPRHEAKPGTNPPVFAWKPVEGRRPYHLEVARDSSFNDTRLDVAGLSESTYLPEDAFEPGRYFWRWSRDSLQSEAFSFEITSEATVLAVPPADEWLRRFPDGHPRIYIGPEDVPALRESRHAARAERWQELQAAADALLAESHEMAEPPYLPDRRSDYREYFRTFLEVLWTSRRFVKGAEALALAYLASGETQYARAACQRLVSMSRWDPEGSSHLAHNDEAHMPIIWHGPSACDWVWDQFTEDERSAVVEHLRRRGQITYDHMHGRGSYGVTRFDSHAGREIVFLAQTALLIHEHAPEAKEWLEWLRPVLCGIWPIWAGDDGGWAEGPSYGLAYVNIMTIFATTLKRGAGVDLYRRPFWQNHARWRQYCLPPYAEWIGFGDHTERWASTWQTNADLVELIGRETGTDEFDDYVATFREEGRKCDTPPSRKMPGVPPQCYLAPPRQSAAASADLSQGTCRVFPAAGWAAVRTSLHEPSRDVALIFRSSPFGAISHSHANNNDFIIHVAGKVLAMPSGYYDGYGSKHHAHWVWHTKSHNCVTLSDAGQIMRSHDSRGAVENAFEDGHLVYFRGNADASYSDRASRCRRHVVLLKEPSCFLMIDEFVARPEVASSFQWNIHSWNRFAVGEGERAFLVEREGSSLAGHFMYHRDAFGTRPEGWDPPPLKAKDHSQGHQQYHLRFTPLGFPPQLNLGVVLCPGLESLPRAPVITESSGGAEIARIGDDVVAVSQGGTMELEGEQSDALALLIVGGRRYEVKDGGVER